MGTKEIPIENFDALLHSLITWDLVTVEGTEWQLVERVQRRLSELAPESGPWPAEQIVYVDHRCADCGARTVTRSREGTYVCDPCWDDRRTLPLNEDPTSARRRRSKPHRDERIL